MAAGLSGSIATVGLIEGIAEACATFTKPPPLAPPTDQPSRHVSGYSIW
jgi:hypothetical protein